MSNPSFGEWPPSAASAGSGPVAVLGSALVDNEGALVLGLGIVTSAIRLDQGQYALELNPCASENVFVAISVGGVTQRSATYFVQMAEGPPIATLTVYVWQGVNPADADISVVVYGDPSET